MNIDINANTLSLLIGIFLPILIEIVKQGKMPPWANGLIVLVSSVVFGGFQALIAGQLDTPQSYLQAVIIILAAAVVAYNQFWKPVLGGTAEDPTKLNEITTLVHR